MTLSVVGPSVVSPVDGRQVTLDDLVAHCRAEIAGYKVPRELVVVDEVVRSPVGKADYRWARSTAYESLGIAEPAGS